MVISHVSKIFAIEDAKIGKLLTDPVGGPATYATLIDVPGIKEITFSPEINNVELRGDNKRLESDSILVGGTISVSHAKMSLDALAVMMGGTVTDSGTTPNQKATFTRLSTDAFSYFKIEGKTPTGGIDQPAGDGHLLFHKCKVTDGEFTGFAEEDYRTVSFDAMCVWLIATDKLFDIILNETAVAIT